MYHLRPVKLTYNDFVSLMTDLASAVKIEEPSGKRNILQLPYAKVAQLSNFVFFF